MGAAGTDAAALAAELLHLEREEREVSRLRQKLHERLASFENAQTAAREVEVSAQRRELHRRIDALRAELAAVEGHGPNGRAVARP